MLSRMRFPRFGRAARRSSARLAAGGPVSARVVRLRCHTSSDPEPYLSPALRPERVLSPGGWEVPGGRLAGWNWVPPDGAWARPELAPWWLRCWYRTPCVDRWAYPHMWARGCWEVEPAPAGGPPEDGLREPRPAPPAGPEMLATATVAAQPDVTDTRLR